MGNQCSGKNVKQSGAQVVLSQAGLEGHSGSSAAGLRPEMLSSGSGARNVEGELHRVHSGQ